MSQSASGHFLIETIDGAAVVRFADTPLLRVEDMNELISLLESRKDDEVRINLEGIFRVSSAVLGCVIRLQLLTKKRQAKLRLFNLESDIREVFRISRLDNVLIIDDDPPGALMSR